MKRQTNTDQVSSTDRQAAGNQPDHSTPAGTEPTGVVPPPPGTGTVTSIAGDGSNTVTLTPDPITNSGTVGLENLGGAAGPVGDGSNVPVVTIDNYGRVTALTDTPISYPPAVVSITAGTALDATPNPITNTGTIFHQDYGTPGNYQRVTTNTQGHVTDGENDVVNVKQYGAVGDGVTNDTAAINNAIAAMTSYGTLYFPPGKYLVTPGSLGSISGMDYVTIMGDGWASQLYSSTTGAPGNFLVVDNTCQYVALLCFSIVGSATVRGSGIGIRLYASDSQIRGVYIKGTSDFAIHLDGDGSGTTVYQSNVQVLGCRINAPLGDGIHASAVKNFLIADNLLTDTGDDSLAVVSESNSFQPTLGTVANNVVYNAGARGIAILEAVDFLVSGNIINTSYLAGIEVGRFNSTTAYNTRGKVLGNKLYNTTTNSGPIGNIGLYWCQGVDCDNNLIDTPATGSGIGFIDVLNVAIRGNVMKGIPAYGIRGLDFGIAHVATTQGPLSIKGNVIFDCVDYAVYAVADTGCTIFNMMVNENEGTTISGANVMVYYDRITNGRVINNYSYSSAITAGGTVSGVTATPNY